VIDLEEEDRPWFGRGCSPRMGFGPWKRNSMWESEPTVCPCCGRITKPMTKTEKLEEVEAYKRKLEEKLVKANVTIEKLKKEE
jgi:hypothetical protein